MHEEIFWGKNIHDDVNFAEDQIWAKMIDLAIKRLYCPYAGYTILIIMS